MVVIDFYTLFSNLRIHHLNTFQLHHLLIHFLSLSVSFLSIFFYLSPFFSSHLSLSLHIVTTSAPTKTSALLSPPSAQNQQEPPPCRHQSIPFLFLPPPNAFTLSSVASRYKLLLERVNLKQRKVDRNFLVCHQLLGFLSSQISRLGFIFVGKLSTSSLCSRP